MASNRPDPSAELSAIVTRLPTIYCALGQTVQDVETITNTAMSKVAELREAGVKIQSQAKDAYRDVKTVVQTAYTYIGKVDNFFECGNQAKETVQQLTQRIKQEDYQPLLRIIHQLRSILAQAKALYLEFNNACKAAERTTYRAAEECRRRKVEAESNKETAQVVGGITTVGVGLLAIITLGMSTPFTIGTMVSGAAALATTIVLAKQYAAAEKLFRELSSTFRQLERSIIDIENEIEIIDNGLASTSSVIIDVELQAKSEMEEPQGVQQLHIREGDEQEMDTSETTEATAHSIAIAYSAELLLYKLNTGHLNLALGLANIKRKEQELKVLLTGFLQLSENECMYK